MQDKELAKAIKEVSSDIYSYVSDTIERDKTDKNSLDKYDIVMVLNKNTNCIDVTILKFIQNTMKEFAEELKKMQEMTEEEKATIEEYDTLSTKWSPHISKIPIKLSTEHFKLDNCDIEASVLFKMLNQVVLEKLDPRQPILNRYIKRYNMDDSVATKDLNINPRAANIATLHELNNFAGLHTRTGNGISTTIYSDGKQSVHACELLTRDLFMILNKVDNNLILDISFWAGVE